MVVVRESPRSARSPDANSQQWPPNSPFAALMSSPSGRKKWQTSTSQRQERTPSPSPLRRPFTALSPSSRSANLENQNLSDTDDEEEEDEETVQLKLAEIQAKLKIKALQRKAKRSTKDVPSDSLASDPMGTALLGKDTKPSTSSLRSRTSVQVPLSPTRAPEVPKEAISPARRKLGLLDVRKAEDVSLKRPRDNTFRSLVNDRRNGMTSQDEHFTSLGRPMTFSERLVASRNVADQANARREKIEQARTEGFGRDGTTFAQAQRMIKTQTDRPTLRGYESMKHPSSAHATTPSIQRDVYPTPSNEPTRNTATARAPTRSSSASGRSSAPQQASQKASTRPSKLLQTEEGSSGSFESFSEIHLSKRNIAHPVVAREMETREVYTLPRLLKEVKSPEYEPPDCECDFVVFAILAAKSSPFDQKAAQRTSDDHTPQEDAEAPRNKFMVLTLCDLKWEIDCFLFGTAFDQFWKLTPGTLLAILNPGIMPPKKNSANGRFSLKLGSSEDSVMEIGMARDLGYCDSVKKDGQKCHQWIDKRSAKLCEFHLNLLIDQDRKSRMEVNTMFRGAVSGASKYRHQSHDLGEKGFDLRRKAQANYNPYLSRSAEYGRLYSVPSSLRGSTAKMLDNEDTDALHSMTREEASRKRIAAAQKERDLAKRLGEMGNGMGAEYLRASHPTESIHPGNGNDPSSSSSQIISQTLFEKPKVSDLGLLDNKATDIHLSPAKDRKRHFGLGISSKLTTAGGSEAMGWGGAKKAGLLQAHEPRVKSPVKGQTTLDSAIKPRTALVRERTSDGSLSPKKRARFALEKGIREPGRESLGGDDLKALTNRKNNDDDDDDLDIV